MQALTLEVRSSAAGSAILATTTLAVVGLSLSLLSFVCLHLSGER